MAYEHLLQPIQIRGLTLRNRILLPGMATAFVADQGYVTQRFIDYHVARARGGCALNVLEATTVHTAAAPRSNLALHDDRFLPGLRELNDAVHAAGGRTGIQLWEGGFVPLILGGEAISVVPSEVMGLEPASVELIHESEKAFGEAAARAARAGFDCVEFHCAHNYSPHMFLSAAFNQRTDEYGGSFENRMRYPLNCLRAIRASIPGDMPILIRISPFDDYLPDGMTLEDTVEFLKRAREAGADAADISRGNMLTPAVEFEIPTIDITRGFNVDNAAAIRQGTGMLTIAVGRINDPDQAEEIIAGGKADMVMMGRAQIADPEFANKVKSGRTADIVRCIGCNQGCFDRCSGPDTTGITCLQNPGVGREVEFRFEKADQPRTVLIAGGGMAGMQAAAMLQERGHHPILCEAGSALGGQFLLAGMAPRKEEVRQAVLARASQLERAGVDIRLKTRVDARLIEKYKPDVVIVAVGGEPIRLNVPGVDGPNVTDAVTVLTGKSRVKGQIAVIGGGLVGLEVAEYLSQKQKGVTGVTVVEMLYECGADLGSRKQCIMENLERESVCTMVNSQCVEILRDAVVADCTGERKTIPCDGVAIAVGWRPADHSEIEASCHARGIPCYVIGDAKAARKAIDATAEAADAVLAICAPAAEG